jgi:plastocyanin
MPRTHLAVAGFLAGIVLIAAGCGGSKSSSPPPATTTTTTAASSGSSGGTLDGSVGPGFVISLTKGGSAVTTLPAGTYTLKVNDQADAHNFHLTGPGVDVSTDVGFVGTKSFTVTLKAGKYHYQCDPHSTAMNGDFTVS